MKVLKILAIVFGVLLLVTGAGLLVGSYAVGRGNEAIQTQARSNGLSGPVNGVVKAVDGQQITVDYTDESGEAHTAQGQAAVTRPVEPGDTVSVYYSPDQPEFVVATDVSGSSLTSLASGLRTGGIVSLILGGLLLLAGILSLVLGKKTPAVAGGPAPGQPYGSPQYPPAAPPYPAQPGPPYPAQPGQYFAPQPGQQYPAPPGQPTPPQPGQPYPQQPPSPYASQPYPPQQHPPAGPPSAS